jgi:hypothetical protein
MHTGKTAATSEAAGSQLPAEALLLRQTDAPPVATPVLTGIKAATLQPGHSGPTHADGRQSTDRGN